MRSHPPAPVLLAVIAAVLASIIAFRAGEARADEAALRYTAPSGHGCPDAAWLRERIGVGRAAPEQRIEVHIELQDAQPADLAGPGDSPRQARLVARIVLRRDRVVSERELAVPAGRCPELAEAIALAVALALDNGTARPPAPAPPAEPALAPPAEPAAVARVAPSPGAAVTRDAAAARARLRVSGMLFGSLGAAPAPTAGAAMSLGVEGRRLRLDVEVGGVLPAERAFEMGRVRESMLAAQLVPCVRLGRVWTCATALAGAARTAGRDFDPSRAGWAPQLGLGARAAMGLLTAGGATVEAHAGGLVHVLRVEAEVGGALAWHQPLLRMDAGLSVRLPL